MDNHPDQQPKDDLRGDRQRQKIVDAGDHKDILRALKGALCWRGLDDLGTLIDQQHERANHDNEGSTNTDITERAPDTFRPRQLGQKPAAAFGVNRRQWAADRDGVGKQSPPVGCEHHRGIDDDASKSPRQRTHYQILETGTERQFGSP